MSKEDQRKEVQEGMIMPPDGVGNSEDISAGLVSEDDYSKKDEPASLSSPPSPVQQALSAPDDPAPAPAPAPSPVQQALSAPDDPAPDPPPSPVQQAPSAPDDPPPDPPPSPVQQAPSAPDVSAPDPAPSPVQQSKGSGSDVASTSSSLPSDSRELAPIKPATDIAHSRGGVGSDGDGDGSGSEKGKGRIGDQLVEKGLITKDQLNVALQEKKVTGQLLGEVMVELGFISSEALAKFLSESSGFEIFNPADTIVDGDALGLLEKDMAIKHKILSISFSESNVLVVMVDPFDIVAIDFLRSRLPDRNLNITPLVTTPTILLEAIDAAYGYASSINDILKELEKDDDLVDVATISEDEAYTHPIVRLVNALVFDGVKAGVSDLHFEPEANFVRLRCRLDGVLYTAQILHKKHWQAIAQRIKIMSSMNIADKMGAQDGRFGVKFGGRDINFRVSSLPTVNGENIVMRVLDQSQSIMPLGSLGFSEHNLGIIKRAQSRPEGIIIVTGPTGSGKSTSLYSMLNEISTVDVNIQTLEDPVEYSVPLIRQTAVREGVLEFADGIRAMLRQDPDIIFIGEIRDNITADMALKAAMTGHQVYTTLHTNDSFGAIPRLLDLDLKPGMISGAIVAVFAQRLVRRLCPECREAYTPDSDEIKILELSGGESVPEIYKAKQGGCQLCVGQGYKGRSAVVEILEFDDDLDEMVAKDVSKAELKAVAVEKGFKNMKDDGILKVLDGLTSLEALSKVVDVNK